MKKKIIGVMLLTLGFGLVGVHVARGGRGFGGGFAGGLTGSMMGHAITSPRGETRVVEREVRPVYGSHPHGALTELRQMLMSHEGRIAQLELEVRELKRRLGH